MSDIPLDLVMSLDKSSNYKFLLEPANSIRSRHSYRLHSQPLQQKLEVESVSTTSLPLSIPYAYIANGGGSFDTVNLFSQTGQYSNTQHMPEAPKPTTTDLAVPQRFSAFIPDQPRPRPIDEGLLDLLVYREKSLLPKQVRKLTDAMRRSLSTKKRALDLRSSYSVLLGISNLMGSQATIFSTRQDAAMPRRSRTRARLYTTNSDISLTRSKAIRFKQGGWLYRLRVRLHKLAARFKDIRFKFPVTSKRVGPSRARSRFWRKKLKKNKLVISPPHNNPLLGALSVEHIRELDDATKYKAGAAAEDLHLIHSPLSEQFNHMSMYIAKTLSEDTPRKSSRSIGDSYFESADRTTDQTPDYYGNSLDPGRKASLIRSDYSTGSEPPAPPPHQAEYTIDLFANTSQAEVLQLWKDYLWVVLVKRIQLRREINVFRSLLLGQELEVDRKDSAPSEALWTASYTSSKLGTSLDVTEVVEVDSTTEKFNAMNRRSMLGDMLDYDSDDLASTAPSVMSGASGEVQRYGTLKRSMPRSVGTYDLSAIGASRVPSEETPPAPTAPTAPNDVSREVLVT